MKSSTQFNHYLNIKSKFKDMFSRCITYQYSHLILIDERNKIFNCNSWLKLTTRNRNYFHGMFEQFSDELHRHYVKWFHYYYNLSNYAIYVEKWEQLPQGNRDQLLFKSGFFYPETFNKFSD